MKLVYREHPDIEVALGDRPLINNHINAGKEQVEVAAITTNSGILMIMHDNGEYEAVFASEIGAEWVDSEIETQIQDNVSHGKHPTSLQELQDAHIKTAKKFLQYSNAEDFSYQIQFLNETEWHLVSKNEFDHVLVILQGIPLIVTRLS